MNELKRGVGSSTSCLDRIVIAVFLVYLIVNFISKSDFCFENKVEVTDCYEKDILKVKQGFQGYFQFFDFQ